ncbi:MAG: hypothetical protein AAF732_03300 [Pseudomonadota bacterium]
MTLQRLPVYLLVLVIGIAVIAALLRVWPGPGWFAVYGVPTLALIATPGVGWIVSRRLRTNGHHWAWSLLVTLPLFAGAAVEIASWVLFFSSQDLAVLIGLVRAQVARVFDPLLPIVFAALAAMTAIVSWKLVARNPRAG